jgi:hypothetical protein
VQPVPLHLLVHLQTTIASLYTATDRQLAIIDVALMDFFFLLRPVEYCKSGPNMESCPFRLRDVMFSISDADCNTATPAHTVCIRQTNYVVLYFTAQKNGIHSEAIGQHGTSGHPTVCLLHIIRCHMSYTNDPLAPPLDTALCSVLECQCWHPVPSTAITAVLCTSANAIGDSVGLKPGDISARALWAGSAMVLLLGKEDYPTI